MGLLCIRFLIGLVYKLAHFLKKTTGDSRHPPQIMGGSLRPAAAGLPGKHSPPGAWQLNPGPEPFQRFQGLGPLGPRV